MNVHRLSSLGLLALAGLFGCATEGAQTPPPAAAPAAAAPAASEAAPPSAAADADAAMAEVREHHRHHHVGGITQFIAMSLDTVGQDDAKRDEIEKLQGDLHACMASSHQIEKRLLSATADGVAAGAVDTSRVDELLAQLSNAADGAHFCSTATLNALHAMLTPEERAALVDKVEAHWEVWRGVNHEAVAGGTEKEGRVAELTKEVNLSPDQVQKISDALKAAHAAHAHPFDPAKAEAHLKAFATAFASDTFDARSIMQNANGAIAVHGAHRMMLFYETVTPLLTPDQRTTLAEHLRERVTRHHPAVSSR